jgi:hypothetical protein
MSASYETHYNSDNYPREFNTDEFYKKIIKNVILVIGRPLIKTEIDETINFIKKLDPSLLAPLYQAKTIKIVVDTLVEEFNSFDCNKPQYSDSQQILRETIGTTSETSTVYSIYDDPAYLANLNPPKSTPKLTNTHTVQQSDISSLLGITSSNDAVRILNPNSLLRKNYIMLDSRYRELNGSNSDGITSFTWNYVLQSVSMAQGTVNIVGNVRDIVALRIYPSRIPYVLSADNKYSRISVLITELSSQSFISHEHRNFHFMLKSVIDDTFINLVTHDYNDGYFYFEKPITTLNKLTLSFGSPLEPIVFDRDRDFCTIDYFTMSPLTNITTGPMGSPRHHNLTNGDRVYFTNFNTGYIDPVLDQEIEIDKKIVSNINKLSGWIITVIDDFSFSIIYNTSSIQSPLLNLEVNVFYGSKRMFIPIELTYIMPEPGRES